MKPCCRNCHFLSKELREENTGRTLKFSLSKQEREKALKSPHELIESYYSLNCQMGVWDEGISGSVGERNSIINIARRAPDCFFFPYHPALLFDAARELQMRADENTQLKRSNFYTRVALWVAVGALLLDALKDL